jgi:hypothetical protein
VDSWREVAARVVAEECQGIREQLPPALSLPIAAGLASLAKMNPPRRLKAGCRWDEIKGDAARLAAEGWALNALALGWHPLELFGCGGQSSSDFEGLAVWLSGRKVALLDERSAVAAHGGAHFIFNRRHGFDPSTSGGVFLWEFGRDG